MLITYKNYLHSNIVIGIWLNNWAYHVPKWTHKFYPAHSRYLNSHYVPGTNMVLPSVYLKVSWKSFTYGSLKWPILSERFTYPLCPTPVCSTIRFTELGWRLKHQLRLHDIRSKEAWPLYGNSGHGSKYSRQTRTFIIVEEPS